MWISDGESFMRRQSVAMRVECEDGLWVGDSDLNKVVREGS